MPASSASGAAFRFTFQSGRAILPPLFEIDAVCTHLFDMTTPHTVADEDQIWAARFRHLGLGSLAPVLLDAFRPLGLVSSQLLTMAAPVLTTFVNRVTLDQFTSLLEDPDRLERVSRLLTDEADE
jgi:hypothetical protein